MSTRKNLKNLAKSQLNKKTYWTFTIIFAIYTLLEVITIGLQNGLDLHITAGIFAVLILIPIQFGLYFSALRITEKKLHICSFMYFISSGFKKYIKTIGLTIILSIIISIATMFFVIPGIILALMFSQSIFIMCSKDCGIFEALNESRKLMQGHKWEFFILEWSFILWGLLIFITVGLASIFIMPYIITTFANYYRKLQLDYTYKNPSSNYKK